MTEVDHLLSDDEIATLLSQVEPLMQLEAAKPAEERIRYTQLPGQPPFSSPLLLLFLLSILNNLKIIIFLSQRWQDAWGAAAEHPG